MIASIIYVGREALEMVFLTYFIASALRINAPTILAALAGLVSGVAGGFYLSTFLEPYEWASYGVLSVMMLYLFINTVNIKGKNKLVRNRRAFKSGYKKAIVTLKKGQSIDLATGI